MFCTNCGHELDDDAVFCEQCGTQLTPEQESESVSAPVSPPAANTPGKGTEVVNKMLQYVKENKKQVGIIAGIIVVVAVIAIFLATRPLTVKLDKYVSVEFDGCDSVGTARVHFDEKAFCDDYGQKIKYIGSDKSYASLIDDSACRLLLGTNIDGNLDKDNDLSNGDSIVYQWHCDDEEVKKNFGVRLSYKDITFTVEGLEEPESVDPFAELELEYHGIAPNAEVRLHNNSDAPYKYDLNYEAVPNSGLSNGDTITVSVPYADTEEFKHELLKRHGIALTQTSKTYTVEGLEAYVSSLSGINEEMLEKLKNHGTDILNADVAKNWAKECTLKEATYLGNYLLIPKNSSGYNNRNILYLVYQVNAAVTIPDEEIDETVSYYYVISFENLIAAADGTVSTDLDRYRTCDNRFAKELGNHRYSFKGFETLDEAFKQCVTVNVDRYTYESSVTTE